MVAWVSDREKTYLDSGKVFRGKLQWEGKKEKMRPAAALVVDALTMIICLVLAKTGIIAADVKLLKQYKDQENPEKSVRNKSTMENR